MCGDGGRKCPKGTFESSKPYGILDRVQLSFRPTLIAFLWIVHFTTEYNWWYWVIWETEEIFSLILSLKKEGDTLTMKLVYV